MAHPIPAGHHTITPHLIIKGAAEAIEFYKRAFGAEEISRMPFSGENGQMKLGHAELQIGDSRLFLADGRPLEKPRSSREEAPGGRERATERKECDAEQSESQAESP